ncbi:polymer-forming cytoskeletal protein [Ruminococcus flavefaciens]|uniref:polymer-forming cytoskeletal protein n=1 Tax=Ruminococcus flavefaciens TaxID=1265 RepID=UPI0004646E50|nr:polymer-forming cytoskeletal protein [Ruminococcus flavefaciens]
MKTEKRNKLRGTVLFTVVAVMALLIIFLTGTLALATASSNRAHKSYSSSQASYTAKTAISGFTEAMSRDSNIAKTVVSLGVDSNPSVIYPEVRINKGSAVDKSVGLIGYWDNNGKWQDNKIIVEKVNSTGTDQYYYDLKQGSETYGKWVKVDMVKITATARVAKEEATVTAYIKKRPEEKNTESPSLPTGIKGFNTVGDGNFRNGGRFTGGLGIGLKSNVKNEYVLHNACEIDTTLTFINGDVRAGTSTFAIDVHDSGERPVSETIINGNLYLANGQDATNPLVQLNYKMNSNYRQQQIPYLYIDGVLSFGSQCTLVAAADNDHKSPYNIFVGTLMANRNDYRCDSGDLYMMDEYTGDDNVYSDVFLGEQYVWNQSTNQNDILPAKRDVIKGDNYYGNGGTSYLYKWVNSVYNKTINQNESYGGSMYCNGRLHISNVNYVEGDVRVKGDCYVDGNTTIKGDLVVGGALHVNGSLTARRIFCDNVGTYGGTSGNVTAETFTTVNNTLHIPDELKPYGNNLSELSAYEVEFPKRSFFVWDPAAHKDSAGNMMLIDGNEANDSYVLYYSWKEEYAPGMKIYMDKELRTFKYIYGDETFEEDGYEFVGTVDETLDALLASESFLRDDVTTDVVKTFLDKPIYSSELPKVDGETRTWYYVMPKYVRDDNSGQPLFRETSIRTDSEKGYYIVEGNTDHKFITQLPYYTLVTYDGQETNTVVSGSTTIYSDTEPHNIVDADYVRRASTPTEQTVVNSNIYKYASYGEPAYPVKMERTAIYADKSKKTKIVRTLTEVREEMNLDNLEKSYPKDVPASYKTDAEGNIEYDGSDASKRNTTITKSCTIKNDVDNVKITINPQGKTIWVILENVTMKNGADIFVDLIQTDDAGNKFEAGKVCFLVKGMLYLSNQNSIVNKEVTTGGPYFCKNCPSDTFDYTKDWGMEFYGTEQDTSKGIPGSTIQMTNLSTITGAFRCPYTNFACMQKGKWTVKYIDEYGVDWSKKAGGQTRGADLTSGAPPIIGNALFKDVLQQDSSGNDLGMNEFGMYYTQCGQGGSAIGNSNNNTKVTTSEGVFDILYFSGV